MPSRALQKLFGLALTCLCLTIPAWTEPQQDRSQRPGSPGNGQQPGGPPARPNPGNNPRPARPSPGQGTPRPNPGQGGNRPNPGNRPGNPQIQPVRPNPGGPNRPSPGNRPNPGGPNRPNPGNGRPPSHPGGRPPNWGRPPQNRPSYNFRPNDRDLLRRHYYSHLRYINRARRPIFTVGGYFPFGDIGYLTPVPYGLYGSLPPIPPGYQIGYFDGYVVVYDPLTYFIANLVDLLQ